MHPVSQCASGALPPAQFPHLISCCLEATSSEDEEEDDPFEKEFELSFSNVRTASAETTTATATARATATTTTTGTTHSAEAAAGGGQGTTVNRRGDAGGTAALTAALEQTGMGGFPRRYAVAHSK